MDTTAQLIAIGESLDWTIRHFSRSMTEVYNPLGKLADLPDFLNDHNAMSVALSTLNQDGQFEFFYNLNEVVGLVDAFSPAWIKEFAIFALINATAAQKAEAYLKTIGKWKED